MKSCSTCAEDRPLTDFHKDALGKDGRRAQCKFCVRDRHKKYSEENRPAIQEKWRKASGKYYTTDRRRNKTLRHYGLTEETYNELYDSQDGKCAICGSGLTLCVDHCHESNKVRGLLCNKCNLGLGHFEDDVDRMKRAIEYLEAHNL